MREWAKLLGGLTVWSLHLFGVYAIFSWADLDPGYETRGRAAALLFSVVCVGVAAGLALAAFRRPDGFRSRIAAWGGLVAVVAILFQTAPVLLS